MVVLLRRCCFLGVYRCDIDAFSPARLRWGMGRTLRGTFLRIFSVAARQKGPVFLVEINFGVQIGRIYYIVECTWALHYSTLSYSGRRVILLHFRLLRLREGLYFSQQRIEHREKANSEIIKIKTNEMEKR